VAFTFLTFHTLKLLGSSAAAAGKVLATPAVRRLAVQYTIDLSTVPATGKDGRVLKEDILAFLESSPVAASMPTPTTVAAAPPPKAAKAQSAPPPPPARRPPVVMEKDVTEKMSPIVRVMSKTMTASLKIPHFGYKDEVDMGALVRLRKQLKHQENKVSRGFILKEALFSLSLLMHFRSKYHTFRSW
jgi:pyruvate/2-oxoglutarate dehydrogenase complex dihydrolipoamide acyltransferase (E2) component